MVFGNLDGKFQLTFSKILSMNNKFQDLFNGVLDFSAAEKVVNLKFSHCCTLQNKFK